MEKIFVKLTVLVSDKATTIKIVWDLHKDKNMNGTKSKFRTRPKYILTTYFRQDTKTVPYVCMDAGVFSTNYYAGTTRHPPGKKKKMNLHPYLIPYAKISLRWVTDSNIKASIVKLLGEII